MKLKKPQVLMYFVNAFFWMSIYTYVPMFPQYVNGLVSETFPLGMVATVTGIITGAYGVTQMLLRLPLGILSDQLKRRKPFILAGIAAGTASALLMFFVGTPAAMFVGRLMAGLCACAYVQVSVLFASYYEDRHTTKSLGFVEGSTATGQLTAVVLGGLAGSLMGDKRYAFLMAAALGVVGFALALMTVESRKERKAVRLRDIGVTLSEKTLIVASVLAIFTLAINFGKAFVFSLIAAEAFKVTELQKSLLTVLVILPTALFSPLTGSRLIPRFGTRAVVAAGFVLQAVSCAMAPFTGHIAWLYLSQFITGMGYSLTFPSLMALSVSKMPDEKRATAMGFYQAVYGIGIFAGPWLTGWLTDLLGQNLAFFLNAGMALLAAAGAVVFIAATAGRRAVASFQ